MFNPHPVINLKETKKMSKNLRMWYDRTFEAKNIQPLVGLARPVAAQRWESIIWTF